MGLGVGSSRARLIKNTEGAELKCVVDLNEALAKQIAEELNTEWAPNLDTILGRGDIDCVMVMTPSGTHAALGIRVAQAGKHVITTKPMDVSTEACDRPHRRLRRGRRQVSCRLSEPLCGHQLSRRGSPSTRLAR